MSTRTYQARLKAPFATLGIVTDDKHLLAIDFLPKSTPGLMPQEGTLAFAACTELNAYLQNPHYRFKVPVKLTGTRHQLAVWEAMQKIPAGKTRTYGEIAAAIKSSPRAIGGACGTNRIPIVVPCHRITAANGLGGFMQLSDHAGDPLAIKRWLLAHEGVAV